MALAFNPAIAQNEAPHFFHFTTLHGGRIVNKTKLHNHGATHITYTVGVYTYVSASNYRKTQILPGTFAMEEYEPCNVSYLKMTAPKKAEYGKVGIVTETYTGICGEGVKTVLYGNSYKLTDPNAQGKTDHFVSSIFGKFENNGTKYKGRLNLDVQVSID